MAVFGFRTEIDIIVHLIAIDHKHFCKGAVAITLSL